MQTRVREIPEGSVEIQTGLWLYTYTRVIGGIERTFRQLFSAEGYCFYDLQDEYYDDEGNRIPEEEVQPEQRMYYQWMSIPLTKNLEELVSVPVQDGFEIANTVNPPVTE